MQVETQEMSKETTRYIENINIGMNYIQKQHNKNLLPVWQIDYNVYGGLKAYLTIRDMYWKISAYYIDVEGKYDATNFPLSGYEEGITTLLKQFRVDLQKPIKWYENN